MRGLVLVGGLALFGVSLASAEEKVDAKAAGAGRGLFLQYCTSCHGTDAKGAGPAAASLKVPSRPHDLAPEGRQVRRGEGPDFHRGHAGQDGSWHPGHAGLGEGVREPARQARSRLGADRHLDPDPVHPVDPGARVEVREPAGRGRPRRDQEVTSQAARQATTWEACTLPGYANRKAWPDRHRVFSPECRGYCDGRSRTMSPTTVVPGATDTVVDAFPPVRT